MRILQLIAQSKLGGAESVGFTLASEFARRGHETLLLSNRRNGPLLDRSHPPNMATADLPRASRLDPRIVSFLFGQVARFRPDVIHAHNYEASVWARFVGLFHPRTAVVVHVHSSRFVRRHGRQRILTDRVLFRRADAVIALNDAQKEFLLGPIGLPPRKLHLVSNGIDTERFAPPPGTARRPRSAVCVASLTDVKNQDGLLRAWAVVRRTFPDAHLTLVGDGPQRAHLETLAQSLGLQGAVTFAGLQDDVRPALWDAEVFVLPSHSEALPLSLLEAMAAGCAPVASAVGGIPDVLTDGVTGRLVPPGQEEALATALTGLFASTGSAATIGSRAVAEVARRFGMDAWIAQLDSIYRESLRVRRVGKG